MKENRIGLHITAGTPNITMDAISGPPLSPLSVFGLKKRITHLMSSKSMWLLVIVPFFIGLTMIACGDNSTGPKPEKKPGDELVGIWEVQDTNMFDLLSNRFETWGPTIGATPQDIKAFRDEMAEAEQGMKDSAATLHLNANNTFWESPGEKGTWGVNRSEFTMIYDNGLVSRSIYFIDGDSLTLSMSKARFLNSLGQFMLLGMDPQIDPQEGPQIIEFYDILLNDLDVIRTHYRKIE